MNRVSVESTISLAFTLGRILRHRMAEMHQGKVNFLQLHTLGFISEHSGPTMKELASHLKVASPSATSFVDRLVKLKWVKRMHDERNRKLVRLHVTGAGKRALVEHIRRKKVIVASILLRLPKADRTALERILRSLIRTLDSSS